MTDDMSTIITASAALIAAILGAKPFWEWMKIRSAKKEKESADHHYLEQMFYLKQIADKMALIRHLKTVTRVIIFIGHNGGGLPRVGSRYYTSAVHWDVEPEYEGLLKEYRGVEVDGAYIEMLLDSHNHGCVKMVTATMPECKLKRYYQDEGVVESLVFYLDMEDNNFIYLSVSSHEEGGLSKQDESNADLIASSLRNLVRKSNQGVI